MLEHLHFVKGLFAHLIVPMPLTLLLSIKIWEICLCVDYRKLNSITIRDAHRQGITGWFIVVMSSLLLTWHKDTCSLQ